MNISRAGAGVDVATAPDDVARGIPTLRERCFAAGVALCLVLVAVAVAPIGHRKAPEVSSFLPVITSCMIVAFTFTAALLYAAYRADHHPASALLSLAYAAVASFLLVYFLTFPRLFIMNALIPGGAQTGAWLNAVWHILFAWIVLGSVAVERRGSRGLSVVGVRIVCALIAATVIGLITLVTVGNAQLPKIVAGGQYTAFYRTTILPLMLCSIGLTGAMLCLKTRIHNRGNLWIAVVVLALFVETFMTAFEADGRYSYGWYLGRAELAFCATALLLMLQIHHASLLQRMTALNESLGRRNLQIEAFIELQDQIASALPSRQAVIAVLLHFARQQTGADGSVLETIDGDEMLYEAASGMLASSVGSRVKRATSLSGLCAERREILLCADTLTDPRVDRAACKRLGIGSMIVLPIEISADVTAVLKVASAQRFAFGDAEVQTLQLAACNLASGLAAAQKCATLQDSEQRYRILTDAMPQLVAIVDLSLNFTYINERFRNFSGQSLETLPTAGSTLVHPDDQIHLTRAKTAIEAGTDFECELRLHHVGGAFRWHALRAVPLHDAHECQWIVAATDIDERKAAETIVSDAALRLARAAQDDRAIAINLREANRLMVMAEEMARVGHYRVDLLSGEIYWSAEVYRTHGLPPTYKPTLETALAAYHPDDRERTAATIRTSLLDGSPFRFEARIVRPNGSVRSVIAGGQVERAADGTIVGLVGVFQDVTSLKESERERQRLSERAMLATKAGNIGIWEWNPNEGVMAWDSAMYALHGIDIATIPTYQVWLACVHPHDRQRAAASVNEAFESRAPLDLEFRVIWPAGEVRHIRATGIFLHDDTLSASRVVGASWDVTEVRLLAEDLREEKERAEAASRAKSDFLARMSHEIRTPMNGIIGFTTLVLDGELTSEQRRHVMLLRDAGRSLLAIINDILDYSKIEAGKIELEAIPFELRAVCDGALAIVSMEAQPKGLLLDLSVAPDLPMWVSGDPTRLRQILLNLLTNAVKFTERGAIRVRVVRNGASDTTLKFEVADTGIGISLEHRHLLFGEFSQLERSTTRRYGGTGLGLAICRRLAAAMGGTIGVESEPGAGSTFWFTAHLTPIAAPVAVLPERRINPPARRRVLVADDNRVNQIVVEGLLVRDNHSVALVDDGAEAVAAVRSGTFDLVLMDMQMPVMDGIEATRAIRALAAPLCDIPIIALTANAMHEQVARCAAAGMNDHLAKPIDRERLRHAIAQHVPDRRKHALALAATQGDAMPNASQFNDTPTLGIATLLDIFDGDLAGVGELFDAALASIETDLARIEESVAALDMEMLVEAAHRMKGTSGSIRSQHVIALSSTIEQAAKAATPSIDPALVEGLAQAVAELRGDLESHRRTTSARPL